MAKFYAVRNGRKPGIYLTWNECREQTNGFSKAEFKSFSRIEDAEEFMLGSKEICVPTQKAVAYVDGSYSEKGQMFSFGAVIFHNGEEKHFKKAFTEPELLSMHNVAGEIKGAEFVMQYCADNSIVSVDIYYDYMGIEKWCTGEWQANRIGTQKYAEFYRKISRSVEVNFVKVKGHSGVEYNEIADRLAKEALGIK